MKETRLIYGFHAITTRLRQQASAIQQLYLDTNRRDGRARDLIALAEQHQINIHFLASERLNAMLPQAKHQGVIAQINSLELPTHTFDSVLDQLNSDSLFLVLDGIQDPHNLGACLRVADAMGVTAVIAPKDRAAPLNAIAEKVACGAAQTVPYLTVTNLARSLREMQDAGVWLIGTAADAPHNLYETSLNRPLAWVLGAEGHGMRRLTREQCDELVNIPMYGHVESLNVSVSSGICLAETRRQRSVIVKNHV